MSGDLIWTCVRQRAGPLVKECRAIRPRLSSNDTVDVVGDGVCLQLVRFCHVIALFAVPQECEEAVYLLTLYAQKEENISCVQLGHIP